MEYNIIPRYTENVVNATSKEEAVVRFAETMDFDMNTYFKALGEGKKEWIINVCNSKDDDIYTNKFIGTEEEVKRCLIHLVNVDRKTEAHDEWDFGCESIEQIKSCPGNKLYAYASYKNYHIDYTAIPLSDIEEYKYEEC